MKYFIQYDPVFDSSNAEEPLKWRVLPHFYIYKNVAIYYYFFASFPAITWFDLCHPDHFFRIYIRSYLVIGPKSERLEEEKKIIDYDTLRRYSFENAVWAYENSMADRGWMSYNHIVIDKDGGVVNG